MTTPSPDYRLIPLTRGQFAIVDAADFEWLNQWKWHIRPTTNNRLYAVRTIGTRAKKFNLRMHRVILGLTDEPIEVDHINGDGLDNRRANLRTATKSENQRNVGKRRANTSGYKGVTWHKGIKRWQAQIRVNGTYKFLGTYLSAEEAYAAYCEKAKELHGEFYNSGFQMVKVG